MYNSNTETLILGVEVFFLWVIVQEHCVLVSAILRWISKKYCANPRPLSTAVSGEYWLGWGGGASHCYSL